MGIYRSNVAALMVNGDGRLLICERLLSPGAWQFPQGGVDEGEAPDDAVVREVEEEIGLRPGDYTIEKSLGGYRYEYPPEVRLKLSPRKAHFTGQEQTYYLCRVKEDAPEVNLMQEPREFARSKWILPEEFQLDWLPAFKRETYRAVLRDFFGVEVQN